MKVFSKYGFRTLLLTLVAGAAFLSLSGCRSYKDIKVTTCELQGVRPEGLRSLRVRARVGVDNPILGFRVSDISGRLLYDGEEFATYTVDPLEVKPRCLDLYDVQAFGTLSEGASLLKALSLARGENLHKLTTDVTARVDIKPGLHKTLKFNGLPVHTMLND